MAVTSRCTDSRCAETSTLPAHSATELTVAASARAATKHVRRVGAGSDVTLSRSCRAAHALVTILGRVIFKKKSCASSNTLCVCQVPSFVRWSFASQNSMPLSLTSPSPPFPSTLSYPELTAACKIQTQSCGDRPRDAGGAKETWRERGGVRDEKRGGGGAQTRGREGLDTPCGVRGRRASG